MKKYLIVYYSRTGTTKKAAKALYRILGEADADIEEIIDLKDRSGILGALKSCKDALSDNITSIGTIKNQPQDYFEIIVATPIWAGKCSDAVRTYLAAYKSDCKELTLITCGNGASGESVLRDIFRRFALKAKAHISLTKKAVNSGDLDSYFDCITNGGKGDENEDK